LNLGAHLLHRTVCVQEFAGKIDDFFPVPMHDHAPGIRNAGNNGCFKVFAVCKCKEFFAVRLRNNNRHAFLRFAYRKLRAVKPGIFFRNPVKLDIQSVRKLADCNGNAARTEIVAAFYQC